MSLKAGKEALLRKHYTEAIAILTEYSQEIDNKTHIPFVIEGEKQLRNRRSR